MFCDLHVDVHVEHLTVLDDSEPMLEHSRACLPAGASFLLGSAIDTGLEGASVDTIVASAGDPYNEPAFWAECRRLLKPGGRVFFTTPSYVWASRFRKEEPSPEHVAAFALSDGTIIDTPSFVLPEGRQVAMMDNAGLAAHLLDRETLADLAVNGVVAPKLDVLAPDEPVLLLYSAISGL